ncbi:RNA-directed DNA polymerase [Caenorhabditis elegans]|nr:RNA-directed DNA polymerase [Caenorhabditis elegans]CTQ86777.1 RNA-directed DNA polymerase [Caenorhabditis elegans]|eukprot:NP_001300078.1 Uncharacterized protein CELE_F16B4.6 [Caenorhabditis elegans]
MTERLEKCDKTTKEHDAISEAVKRAGTVQYMFDIGNRKLDEKPCFLVGNIPSALTSKTRDFDLINHSSKGRTY